MTLTQVWRGEVRTAAAGGVAVAPPVSSSTFSILFHGPRFRISFVLYRPITV